MAGKKRYFSTALVLFIVVFLPLGSLFYLSKGFHYHKGVWEDMKSYGSFPAFNFSKSSREKPFSDNVLKKNVSMVGFYNDSNEKEFLEMFSKFYDQFKQDATQFIGIDLDGNFNAKHVIEKYDLPESKYFIIVDGESEVKSLLNKLKYPDFSAEKNKDGHFVRKTISDNQKMSYPIILLVDEYGELRNYIQWNTKDGFNKLVEQMAILITHHELGDKRDEE